MGTDLHAARSNPDPRRLREAEREDLPKERRNVLDTIIKPMEGGSFSLVTEDISEPTDWKFQLKDHLVIMPLAVAMGDLEVYLPGRGFVRSRPTTVGEAAIVPSGELHGGRTISRAEDSRFSYAVFALDDLWLHQLAGKAARRITLRKELDRPDPFVHQLSHYMADAIRHQDDLSCMMQESLMRTLGLHLLSHYSIQRPAALHIKNEKALDTKSKAKIVSYIHDHIADSLTLQQLADLLGMSTNRFSQAFRVSFGTTPIQYIIAERLRLSCVLLSTTRTDVAIIAAMTGFSSHSHLSQTFAQKYGVPPTEYRRLKSTLSDS